MINYFDAHRNKGETMTLVVLSMNPTTTRIRRLSHRGRLFISKPIVTVVELAKIQIQAEIYIYFLSYM